jgi:formylglycine-generating enzyme required for sulfatase activity
VYGPPGLTVNGSATTANAGWDDFTFPGFNPFNIPLNAYPTVLSPWGLVDVAGGASEWTESEHISPGEDFLRARYYEGSAWNTGAFQSDHVRSMLGGIFPTYGGYDVGFRIAAAVPAPGSLVMFASIALLLRKRRRDDK